MTINIARIINVHGVYTEKKNKTHTHKKKMNKLVAPYFPAQHDYITVNRYINSSNSSGIIIMIIIEQVLSDC